MRFNCLVRFSAAVTFAFAQIALGDGAQLSAEASLCIKDRSKFAEADWPYISYLSTRLYAGESATALERAMKLVIASSTTQPVIERAIPKKIDLGLYRIDLRELRWRYEDWAEVAGKRNPYARYYAPQGVPLIVRADWLVLALTDSVDSDTYFRLFFGGDKIPKTKEDVLKFFDIENKPGLTFGLIEGQSEVSKQGTRLITSLPNPRGYAWITSDVLKLDNARDPVEHPDGGFTPDGQELIIGMPRISSTTGKRGALQFYSLFNGKGEVVARAPVDLVEDTKHFRKYSEIRVSGSCLGCHGQLGLNPFKRNEFRELLKSGVHVFAKSKQQQELEFFHLGDYKTELARSTDDYQLMVELICGVKSEDAIKSFMSAVDQYDSALDLAATAEELGITAKDWADVLAKNVDLSGRLAGLPYGNKIPRPAWEQDYERAWFASHGGVPIKREELKQLQDAKEKAVNDAKPPAAVRKDVTPPVAKPFVPKIEYSPRSRVVDPSELRKAG